MSYVLNKGWDKVVDFDKTNFDKLMEKIEQEYSTKDITPSFDNIFNAFKFTDYNDVKVVLIGQDPYPLKGIAHGLSFSSLASKTPASLIRIYKRMEEETGYKITNRNSSDLTFLAKQGVLLLNVALTCEVDNAGSHLNIGWKDFTNHIIDLLDDRGDCVFVLFGEPAKKVGSRIKNSYKVEGPHPISSTPGKIFKDGTYFTVINDYLKELGKEEIRWTDTEYNEYINNNKVKTKVGRVK